MSRMLRINDVPEHVHRTLESRAALRGQTLNDYIRGELERSASRPSAEELLAMLDRDAPAALGKSSATEMRRVRDQAS